MGLDALDALEQQQLPVTARVRSGCWGQAGGATTVRPMLKLTLRTLWALSAQPSKPMAAAASHGEGEKRLLGTGRQCVH